MKNTVKKILALVFVVAMICTMAVPAFAAEETIDVVVTVKNYDGISDSIVVPVEADEATVEEAIKAFNKKNDVASIEVSVLGTTGLVNKVGGKKAGDIENLFGTGYWAVAVNGKLVAEDLDTVAIEEGDRVVVYWNDPTFDTKLVQVDDSLLEKGVVAFYYYNAEGEKVAFDNVLAVCGESMTVGTPKVEGATVVATVLKNGKSKKIDVIKYKSKKNEKKKIGHRQDYTKIQIEKIEA